MIAPFDFFATLACGVYAGVATREIAASAYRLHGPDAARYHGRCRRGRLEMRPADIRRVLRQMQDAGEYARLVRCIQRQLGRHARRRRSEPDYVGFWLGARGRRVIREMAEAIGAEVLP